MSYYKFYGDICTCAGTIGAVIFFVACVVVCMKHINLLKGEKKSIEMLVDKASTPLSVFITSVFIFFVGIGIRCTGGYISQNYDWIKKSERNNLVRDCPEDSTMSSYCAYKWNEYRIDSTEAAEDMRKYLEKM